MGQKVNPNGLRTGINKGWNSFWFTDNKKDVVKFVKEDDELRKFINKNYANCGISSIKIERMGGREAGGCIGRKTDGRAG